METHEKIRIMRELNKWSQEDMAEKLKMSPGGYAKIERGDTQLNITRLTQIAKIFGMEIWEIMQDKQFHIICQSNNQDSENTLAIYTETIYAGNAATSETETLKLIIQHKDELLEKSEMLIRRLESENQALSDLIAFLKRQSEKD